MSDITSMPFGAAEHCRLDNWAAEYAKKLFVAEAAKRTEEIAQEAEDRDAAIDAAKSDVLSTYASTEQAGVIKLHKLNSYNNSGIVVEADGSAYVYTGEQYGTQRSGDGRIQVAAATEAEIAGGTQQYKPIVPATLKTAVEKHTGAAADLPVIGSAKPVNLVAAVNAVVNEENKRMTYSASPQRIGTWLDGRPVWRVAFSRALTVGEAADKLVGLMSILPLKTDAAAVIGGYVRCYRGDSESLTDDAYGIISGGSVDFSHITHLDAGEDGVVGWIDFATAESNLRD